MPTRKEPPLPREIYINNDLPTLYVDDVDVRHRDDGINYLSFTTNLPDRTVEQVRLMIGDEHLHGMIYYLCLVTDYFPQKPSKRKRGSSK